jgi:hypothetical protein
MGEVFVISFCFSFICLVLNPEMSSARLVAVKSIMAHELRKLEVISYPTGSFKLYIELLASTRHTNVVPELLS